MQTKKNKFFTFAVFGTFLILLIGMISCAEKKVSVKEKHFTASASARKGNVVYSSATQAENKKVIYREWYFSSADQKNIFLTYREKTDSSASAVQKKYVFPLSQKQIPLDDVILWVEAVDADELRFHLQVK